MTPGTLDYYEQVFIFEKGIFSNTYHFIQFDFEEIVWVNENIFGLSLLYQSPKWLVERIGGK